MVTRATGRKLQENTHRIPTWHPPFLVFARNGHARGPRCFVSAALLQGDYMETVHEVQHSRERTAKDRMLSAEEKRKCRELLSKLDAQDLNALTDTVTNRVVSPENRNGMFPGINVLKLYVISMQVNLYIPQLCWYVLVPLPPGHLGILQPLCVWNIISQI